MIQKLTNDKVKTEKLKEVNAGYLVEIIIKDACEMACDMFCGEKCGSDKAMNKVQPEYRM